MEELIPVAGKIRIVKCSSDKYWYNNRVGELLNIHDICVRNFYIKEDDIIRGILRIDVELV